VTVPCTLGDMRYATTFHVAAPPHAVWCVLEDLEAWPTWTPSMTELSRTRTGPLIVGETVRVKQPRLRAADWAITAVEPGAAFVWSSRNTGVVTTAAHDVAPAPAGSSVTLTIEQTGPLAGVVGQLGGRTVRRYVDLEAAGLKARAEQN
jgi:carbon monoxide dehydrogenase subunit G